MRISCSAPVFMMLLCISVGPCLATMRGGLFEKRTRKQSIIMPEGDPEEVVDSDGYRHQVGRLDLKQLDLDADEIEVQFPGDSGRTRYRRRSRRSRMSPDKPGRRTFFAESEDDSDATLTLLEAAAMDGSTTLTGTVLSNQTVYQIRQLPDQSIVIEATKSSDFPPEYDGPYPESEIQVDAPMDEPLDVVDGLEDFTGTRYLRANASNPERRLSDDGSTLDILVVYTRGAMCSAAGFGSGGNCYPTDQNKATMEALIELAVAETNAAYELSNIPTELRLVKAHYEATYNDYDNGWTTTLNNLRSKTGHFTYVHSMRSQYGADFVAMLVDSSSYCGIGYRPSNPDSDSAFSLTKWSCATGYFSFGHEVAHNMGCNHDRGNAGGSGSYNYGWQDPQGNFRSILAYDCPGSCPRVMRFSNPNVRYLGKVAGDAGANNAQWISERLSTYANFRQSVSNTPNATPQPTPVSQTTPTAAPNTPAPAQVSTSGSLLASMQGGYIGGEGNMFDIVARNDITITNFAVHAYAATTVTIEVYKRKTPGSCEGLHSNSDAWELIGTTSLVASNPASPTVLPVGFMQPVSVPRGTKQAFYVTFAADTNYNRYSPGTQFGRVYSSNGDLEFHEGYALAYKFGNLYYPRVFNGLVYYIDGVQQTTPAPTFAPTPVPTLRPTPQPTVSPTPEPTAPPTPSPTTPPPTMEPTPVPTPTTPTPAPSQRPTMRTLAPTPQPTLSPTPQPTTVPPTLKTTPAPTHAVEIITTMFAGGNGQAGNMFEIEAIQPLTIQSMEIHTYSTKSQRVLIFTKAGSYMGFERDSTQWRQVCDAEVIGQGSGNPTVVPEAVMQAVSVDGGKTQSFYVTLTESAIRYTNGVINTADSNIRFIHSSGKRYDFGDTFANRIFNGRLHYTVDGTVAPATGASSTGPKKNILTTYANRNGSYGNMFTVEAKEDVIIHNMYVHTFHRPGTFVQVEIYKMNDLDASYLTTHDQIDQWQLVGTANVEGQGTGNPTVLPPGTFSSGVAIPKGHSQSLYVTIVGGGLRYSNGASDSINNLLPHTWNDDLIVYEGIGIGVPRFGGMFPFRVFNGALEYSTPNVTLDERPTGDTLAITADTLLNLKGDEGDLCDRSSDCKSNFCGNVVDHGGNALSDGSLTRSRTRGAKHHNNRDLSTSSMVCLANNEIHQDDGAFATSQEEQEHARV